jgi:hypothetical protein
MAKVSWEGKEEDDVRVEGGSGSRQHVRWIGVAATDRFYIQILLV